MATSSTAQFGPAVNEVLDAIGEPQISAANFTNAVRRQRQVQQIVARIVEDVQNGMPDEQWQQTSELVVLPRFTTGLVTDIAADLVTMDAATVDFDAEFNATIEHPYVDEHCLFKLQGDDQWYWVKGTGTNGGEASANLLRLYTKHLKYPASVPFSDTGHPYEMIQVRYALPANCRDPQDFVRFFKQADLMPMGVNEILRKIRSASTLLTGWEAKYFAVGYDVTGHGASPATTDTDGPLVYIFPVPTEAKAMTLVYQRDAIIPIPGTSAFTQVLDIPSDMESLVIYNATTRAKMDIKNNFQEAAIYKGFADEQSKKLQEKNLTASAKSSLAPDMGLYRGHFRKMRKGWGTRLIVEE
jgi:uncharacterized protein YchJ